MVISWISDRLPTIEDADEDGNVLWLLNVSLNDMTIRSWNSFRLGESWIHTPAWRNKARKIAQLIEAHGYLIALSDDGAAFHLYFGGPDRYEWRPLPPLPQP